MHSPSMCDWLPVLDDARATRFYALALSSTAADHRRNPTCMAEAVKTWSRRGSGRKM